MEAIAEADGCREQALLRVVGEVVGPCGRCDNCLRPPNGGRRDWSQPAGQLLAALAETNGCELRNLTRELKDLAADQEERWGWLARRLVQEELIAESNDGAQRLYLRTTGRHYLRRPWPLLWAA